MNHEQPTIIDACAGIGGFSLAFESEGFETIEFAETDSYASAVLRKHWRHVPNCGDIKNLNGCASVFTAGFPCQPFSVAGKRRGDSDERYLWSEIVGCLRRIRPVFALLENVPGLLTIDGGRAFNRILSDLSALGYDGVWNCVPASAVGADHQRDRLWIVAYSHSQRLPTSRQRRKTAGAQECISIQSTSSSFPGRETYPDLLRTVPRIPRRMDRIKCLGNSIVPQVAQIFAKAIYQELTREF